MSSLLTSTTTTTTTSPSSSPSNVGLVVGSTLLGLFLLAGILALLLWWFSPTLQARTHHPHSFAPLHTNDDDSAHPSHRYSGSGFPRDPRISDHVDVDETASSSFLGKEEEEKVGLNRAWSVGSLYKRWAGKEAGRDGGVEWWNPLEEEERRGRQLEEGGGSSLDHHVEGRTPSRIARLVSVRWGSMGGKRLSDVQESTGERPSSTDRGSMVLPPLDDAPTFDDEIDPYIPPVFSPVVPKGPNSIPLSAAKANSYDDEEEPSPATLSPSFRSYIHLIQRSLSSASFGSRSINPSSSSAPPPSTSLLSHSSNLLPPANEDEPKRVAADVQRTASSSTFGPLPVNTSNLSSFNNNNNNSLFSPSTSSPPSSPSPPVSHRNHLLLLPSPNDISPAASFGSSFANYIGAIQRSLSLSRSTTFSSNSNSNSTRRPSPSVSRAPTSRTFGTTRSDREMEEEEEEEEEARLVPALPSSSSSRRRRVAEEEEEGEGEGEGEDDGGTTKESHGTLSQEGEIVEVWGKGSVETAVVGSLGGQDGKQRLSEVGEMEGGGGSRPLPLPVVVGREAGVPVREGGGEGEGGGGAHERAGEKYGVKIRRLPVPPPAVVG